MSDEIDRWIRFMKENPDKWKSKHTEFINAQFQKSKEFIERLVSQPNGKQKVIDAYKIKNLKGYNQLLG
ncbi:MAG: hypothetical protein V1740_03540 [Candidatus Woesearchaeota archaeon]